MQAQVRTATSRDRDAIHALHLRAFPDQENRLVAALAERLLVEPSSPDSLLLVAELDGEVAGHIAFSPCYAEHDSTCLGYVLAPLAVMPEHQQQGLGTQLVETGIRHLTEREARVVLVYGDPAYYGRFGFSAETAKALLPPFELSMPFGWQALALPPFDAARPAVRIRCVAALQNPALW